MGTSLVKSGCLSTLIEAMISKAVACRRICYQRTGFPPNPAHVRLTNQTSDRERKLANSLFWNSLKVFATRSAWSEQDGQQPAEYFAARPSATTSRKGDDNAMHLAEYTPHELYLSFCQLHETMRLSTTFARDWLSTRHRLQLSLSPRSRIHFIDPSHHHCRGGRHDSLSCSIHEHCDRNVLLRPLTGSRLSSCCSWS